MAEPLPLPDGPDGSDVAEPVDGRLLRARRNRQAVVEALLALMEEGELNPPAPRIALRANVSLRTVFQHFTDMESLYAETGRQVIERVLGLKPASASPADPLPERVREFVRHRVETFDLLWPFATASRLREPFSPQLRETRDVLFQLGAAENLMVLGRLTPASALQLKALMSFGTYYVLREELGTTVAEASECLETMVLKLLA